jgi:hypothetical protein
MEVTITRRVKVTLAPGLSIAAFAARVRKGWDPELAATTPKLNDGRPKGTNKFGAAEGVDAMAAKLGITRQALYKRIRSGRDLETAAATERNKLTPRAPTWRCGWCGAPGPERRDEAGSPCCLACLEAGK